MKGFYESFYLKIERITVLLNSGMKGRYGKKQ